MLPNNFVKAMTRDLNPVFFEKFKGIKPWWKEIYVIKNIKDHKGVETQTTSIITPEELSDYTPGQDIPTGSITEGYTVYGSADNKGKKYDYHKTAVTDMVHIKDILKETVARQAYGIQVTLDKYYAKPFIYGAYTAGHSIFNRSQIYGNFTDSSGDLLYDGKPLISDSANKRKSAKQNNNGETATYYNGLGTLNSGDPGPDALKQAYNFFVDDMAYNERDQKIENKPTHLLCHSTKEWEWKEILNSTNKPLEESNTINVANGMFSLYPNRYLTDNSNAAWYLYNKNIGLRALVRQAPAFRFYYTEWNETYHALVTARYGLEIPNWRCVLGVNYTQS